MDSNSKYKGLTKRCKGMKGLTYLENYSMIHTQIVSTRKVNGTHGIVESYLCRKHYIWMEVFYHICVSMYKSYNLCFSVCMYVSLFLFLSPFFLTYFYGFISSVFLVLLTSIWKSNGRAIEAIHVSHVHGGSSLTSTHPHTHTPSHSHLLTPTHPHPLTAHLHDVRSGGWIKFSLDCVQGIGQWADWMNHKESLKNVKGTMFKR